MDSPRATCLEAPASPALPALAGSGSAPLPEAALAASSRSAQLALLLLLAIALILVGSLTVLRGGLSTRPVPVLEHRLDLNQASATDLTMLPGIGLQLAERIVQQRATHGPFRRVDDLLKVPGIGPALLQRIQNDVFVSGHSDPPRPAPAMARPLNGKSQPGILDPNTATPAQLDTLPGIGPVIAQRIIEEREKRPFLKVEDLRRVKGIGPKRMEAIRPFLVFDETTRVEAARK